MKSTIYGIAFILATFGAFSMMAIHHPGKVSAAKSATISHDPDGITGEWDASLEAFGTITKVKIILDCDDHKISGTVESGHTGAGTISEGNCQDGKLNFVAKFSKHESVSFKGELKDGKLTGEYATEGRVSKWEATKKSENAKNDEPANEKNKTNSDVISGDWDAFLTAQGTSAAVTLKLKLEGAKVTGTGQSDHLGSAAIEDGESMNNRIKFKIKFTQATITFTGVLKDGKLSGEFDAGQMTGKWEAKKK
jgi:hypothetical protein